LIHFYKREMNSISDLHALGDLLTGFVSDKDFKRKAQDSEFTAPLPKKQRTIHSLDYSAYLTRISTFKDISWCHPSCSNVTSPLSPLQLARHGWTGVEGEGRLARCISCRENLYLVLPSITSSTFAATLEKQSSRVVTGHAEFCPWGTSPSPQSWATLSITKEEVLAMAKTLLVCGTDLPFVREDTLVKFVHEVEWIVREMEKGEPKKQEKRGRKKCKDVESTGKVKQTAALLALLGWQRGDLEGTMTDYYKARRVGLWNFSSLQGELDRIEDFKVARELSGKKEVKQEEKDALERKYFDPIKEHLSWNPLVVKDETGQLGWETVRDMFKESGLDSSDEVGKGKVVAEKVAEAATIKTNSRGEGGEAVGVLQRVRSLLELW